MVASLRAHWLRQCMVFFLGGALLALANVAKAADVPPTLAGVSVVTAEQAKQMVEAGTPIIDTRVGNEYADAHVKGAKSVPYQEKSARDVGFNAKDDQSERPRRKGGRP